MQFFLMKSARNDKIRFSRNGTGNTFVIHVYGYNFGIILNNGGK